MKSLKSNIQKHLCIGVIFTAFCLCLFSCKNFLDSEEFVKELEAAIAYSNSPAFSIRFSDLGGKISPTGNQTVKVTDEINVIFSVDDEKYFLNWQVYIDNELLSEEEAATYIQFENVENSETKLKVLKQAENIKIQANTIKRPRIVSTTPIYNSEGSYRDHSITIMFDKKLSEDSIHFSKEELIEAGIWDAGSDSVKDGYKLLKNSNNKCFGYQKVDDDNSIVWKNIEITKRIDLDENLLKYFKEPEIDQNDNSVIRIAAKNGMDEMPPVNTDILVNVKSDFGVKVKLDSGKEKLISIGSSYSWSYLTNSRYDNVPPKFLSIEIHKDTESGTLLYKYDANQTEPIVKNFTTDIESTPTKIKDYNLDQGKMWIKASVEDSGSGPKALTATVTKVSNKYYPCNEDTLIENKFYTANLNVSGVQADVATGENSNGEVFDVTGLAEGVYRLRFTATDKNDVPSYQDAYFIYEKLDLKQ